MLHCEGYYSTLVGTRYCQSLAQQVELHLGCGIQKEYKKTRANNSDWVGLNKKLRSVANRFAMKFLFVLIWYSVTKPTLCQIFDEANDLFSFNLFR